MIVNTPSASCLDDYLKTEIDSLNVLKIKCPEQTCSCVLNPTNLEFLLAPSQFERYQQLLLQKMANRTKEIFCPKPGCSKIILPLNDSPHSECTCGEIICNLCGTPKHEGKTCLAVLDPEFEAYALENNLKMCIMCKTMVARVEGCTHITCSICDYEWCWVCGREYSELHDTKCLKTWSPLPPKIIMKEIPASTFGEKVTRISTDTLQFIFSLILEQLFWPFIVFNVYVELRLPARTLEHKLALILVTCFIESLYIFCFGIFAYLAVLFPKNSDGFLVCLLVIGATPWIVKLFIFILNYKKNQKRWMTRNAQVFYYTSANRPNDEVLQNPTQTAPNQPIGESESNDQDVIIELPESSLHNIALIGRQAPLDEIVKT